jgi:hypothetical protein
MEVRGQPQAPTALLPVKKHMLLIEEIQNANFDIFTAV